MQRSSFYKKLLVSSALSLVCASSAIAQTTSFNNLGFIGSDGTFSYSTATAVNSDGSVVAGYSSNAAGQLEAFHWTSGVMTGLGFINGGGSAPWSNALGISGDGLVVVGQGTNAVGQFEAFRWTQATGIVGLGFLGGGGSFPNSSAMGANFDGSVVIGVSINASTQQEAFRWTQGSGLVGLGFIGGGGSTPNSSALAVTGDGSIIAGYSTNAVDQQEAFRWTQGGGMVGLGFIGSGGSSPFSAAAAINNDGSVIVGQGTNTADQPEAFRWTQGGGMVGLGFIGGGGTSPNSGALGVSGDGSIIVGTSTNASDRFEAFRWTTETGMLGVKDWLASNGVNIGTWFLDSANGISSDGLTIVGNGTNPTGDTEAWYVRTLLPPSPPGPPVPPGPPAPPTPVFINAKELWNSILDTRRVAIHGLSQAQGALGDMLFVAQDQCSVERLDKGADRRFCAFITGAGEFWSGDGAMGRGTAGIAMHVDANWTVGLGVHAGHGNFDLRLGGSDKIDSYGGNAYVRYSQGGEGLEILAAATASHLEYDIARRYMNGISATATSKGTTDGNAVGALGRVGWSFLVSDHTTITPFVDISWVRAKLDGYDEYQGPFSFSFGKRSGEETDLKLGVEGRYEATDTLEFKGSIAWTHRLSGNVGGGYGTVIGLFDFENPDLDLPTDWAETWVGANYKLTPDIRLSGQVGTTIGKSNRPDAIVRAGISINF